MSINNTYKSLEDLSSFAKNYKTRLSSAFTENLGKSVLTNYNIPEDSAEKFNNILNFAINCISKDSVDLDSAHTVMSSELSKLLQKYYEQSLNDQDIFTLLYIVLTYNKEVDNYMFSNPMSSFFGITKQYKQTADYFNGIFKTIYEYTTKIDTSANKWYNREYDDSSQQTLLESLIFFYLLNELKTAYDNDNLTNYIENINFDYKEQTFIEEEIFVNKYYLNPANGKTYNYYIKDSTINEFKLCNFALIYDYYSFSKDNDYIPPMILNTYKSEVVNSNATGDNLFDLYYREDNTNNYIIISEQKLQITKQNLFNDELPNITSINDIISTAINKLKEIFINPSEEDKFASITDKLTSDDYKTSLYLVKSPTTYAELMLKKNKILYKFGNNYTTNQKVSEVILNNNLNDNTTQYRYYKNSASEAEHAMAQKYQLISYFEIIKYPIIGYEMINKFTSTFSELPGFIENAGWDTASITLSSNENDCRYLSFAVIYKELNPNYRDVTFADITDLAIANLDESYFLDSGPNIVSPSLYQTMIGDTSLETIETNKDNEANETLKSYPIRDFIASLYTNPYVIHNSRESDIIRYMAGPIYENRYGSNQSQKKEIEYFLELYEETRNYYYMKLLNKSFVHDEYYDEYEKYFIMLYTIERFISYKIDLIRDIDYFDETDIHNFLLTYGLDKLDSSAVFYKQDDYKLEIIRNFTQLVKNKGTTDVVRTLLKIFNGNDAEIEIGKYMLSDVSTGTATTSPSYIPDNSTILISNNINNKDIVKAKKSELSFYYDETANSKYIMVQKDSTNIRKIDVTKSGLTLSDQESLEYDVVQQNDTDLVLLKITNPHTVTVFYYPLGSFKNEQQYDALSHNLQFIEIPYNTDNETKDVINRLSTAKDYNAFTEHDQYWDNSSLTESTLSSFNINTAPTKYSTFDYSLNISEFIVKSRYALELAEYLFERAKININNNNEHTLNNTSDIFNNLVIETDLLPNLNSILTVDKYLRVIRLVYKTIVLSYMKSIYATYPTNENITLNKLGINRNANFVTLMSNIQTRIGNIRDENYEFDKYLSNILEYVKNNNTDASTKTTLFKNNYWPNAFYTYTKYKDNENATIKEINVFSKYKMESTNFADTLTTLDYSFSPWSIDESTNKPIDDTRRIHLLFNEANDNTIARNSFNKIAEYLEGINYISLMNTERDLFEEEQKENSSTYIPNLAFSYLLHELSRNNISEANDSNIYTNLTEKILKIPYDYLLGFNNPSYHFDYKSMNFNNITAIFIEEMFKTFFTVDKNDNSTLNTFDLKIDGEDYKFIKENNLLDFVINDIISDINDNDTEYIISYNNISPATDPETSTLLNEHILKLIELCENLGDILSSQPLMQVYYQFSEEMKNTIDFLTAALRLFISYTSEISEVRATQKYQSDAENVIPVDQYYGVYTNTVADVLYYDEQIIYTKSGGDSNA